MQQHTSCNFRWVYAFGNQKLVAYRPGELVRAIRREDGGVERCCGTGSLGVTCLRAMLEDKTCRLHLSLPSAKHVDAQSTVSLEKDLLDAMCQSRGNSQNAALAVLASMELSESTTNAMLQHLMHLWLHNQPINVTLLYFVEEQVHIKPSGLRTFIKLWARAAQQYLCPACVQNNISCQALLPPPPLQEQHGRALKAKMVMRMPVNMCCNVCGVTTQELITAPSPMLPLNSLMLTPPTNASWRARRIRKQVRRPRHHLIVAALS